MSHQRGDVRHSLLVVEVLLDGAYRSGRVVVDVDVPEPRYLVLQEARYAGWYAVVDGVRRPTLRANFLMQAVPIRPGERHVEFRYRPTSFVAGAVVSGLAWAGLFAFLITSAVRARRARRTIDEEPA